MKHHFRIAACCLALLSLSGAPVFSVPLEELVEPERLAAFAAGQEIISGVQLKNPRPALVPRHEELRRLIDGLMRTLKPGLFAESLYLYAKPAGASPRWTAAERRNLYNETLALSTLSGIQYYSASRKSMRTFYEYSRVIDGPATKKVLPDPVYADPPPALTVYARQRDLTFGDNLYKYEYVAGDDALIFVQENLSPLNVAIITAVGRHKLRSVVAVIDAEDHLLVYAASMAAAAALPGLGERIGNSFTNRAAAVLKWFAGRADRAFAR
ncbi:MAG: hypothetical protein LBP23_06450 [Treponema sp.]|jgi:hypothetical protein|nr:hypothetical protein [Treponema sp.]